MVGWGGWWVGSGWSWSPLRGGAPCALAPRGGSGWWVGRSVRWPVVVGPVWILFRPHCLVFSVFPTRYLIVDRWRLPYFAGPPMCHHGVRPINAWERTRFSTGNRCCAVATATVHCHSPSFTVPESAPHCLYSHGGRMSVWADLPMEVSAGDSTSHLNYNETWEIIL